MTNLAETCSDLLTLPAQRVQYIPQPQDLLDRMLTLAIEGTLPKSEQPELCACLGELAMQHSA